MLRTCFVCGKPLPVEQRATVYCGLRCQELDRRLRSSPPHDLFKPPLSKSQPPKPQPGNARSPWRGPGR